MTKLKEPSFQRVNSPLELPVMQRVTPAGAQARQNTGHRCLLVEVFTHCSGSQRFVRPEREGERRRLRYCMTPTAHHTETVVDVW